MYCKKNERGRCVKTPHVHEQDTKACQVNASTKRCILRRPRTSKPVHDPTLPNIQRRLREIEDKLQEWHKRLEIMEHYHEDSRKKPPPVATPASLSSSLPSGSLAAERPFLPFLRQIQQNKSLSKKTGPGGKGPSVVSKGGPSFPFLQEIKKKATILKKVQRSKETQKGKAAISGSHGGISSELRARLAVLRKAIETKQAQRRKNQEEENEQESEW